MNTVLALLALGETKASDCLALTRADGYVIVDFDDGCVPRYVEALANRLGMRYPFFASKRNGPSQKPLAKLLIQPVFYR